MATQITAVSQHAFQAKAGDCLVGLADISINVDLFTVASLQIVDNDTNATVFSSFGPVGTGTYNIGPSILGCPLSMPNKTYNLRVELLVLGWAGWLIASKQNLQPITLLVSAPQPAGTGQIIIQQSNGMPAPGAKVVVNLVGLPLNIGGYHAEATTDRAGIVNVPEYGQPFGGSTAEVYATWTDSSRNQWYAQGEWQADWLGNWTPSPLTLQLTPGTINPPGPNPFELGPLFGSIPWYVWPIAIAGVATVIIVWKKT